MSERTRIQFNTGRSYTAEGQKIVAVAVVGGILFNDVSRSIHGFIPLDILYHLTDPQKIRERVMVEYDQGYYYPGKLPYCESLNALEREASQLQWEES